MDEKNAGSAVRFLAFFTIAENVLIVTYKFDGHPT
jgi:hypothetical protein